MSVLSPEERYQLARQQLQKDEDALDYVRKRLDEAHAELRNAMNTGGADPLRQVEKYLKVRKAYDQAKHQVELARQAYIEAYPT